MAGQRIAYAPYDEQNPWKLDTFMNQDEWKAVSRWYDHSLRALMPDGRWYEHARCTSRERAYQIMQALSARPGHDYFVIVQCTLVGKDGREKAVAFAGGSEQTILHERARRIAQAGLGYAGGSDRQQRRRNETVKQPPRPSEERIAAMTAIMIEARRASLDLGAILAAALHAAAETLGNVEQLVAGRPGSWEADIVRRLAASAPGRSRQAEQYAPYIQRLAPLFVQMGEAGEDGGDVLSQAMGPAVDELGGLAEFADESSWRHDLINIGRQYSQHWNDDIW